MTLYNTMTRRKEEFVPQKTGEVSIYNCGPTVYNLIHIGNARSFIVFDVLRRYLEHKGYAVRFVRNYTDVEDRIIKRAQDEQVACSAITDRYIAEYETDARGINLKPATVTPRATENIEAILALIGGLLAKGHAYPTADGVYYRVSSFDGYGKLSNQPLEELEAGARVLVDEGKESPLDFALWKAAKPGEPCWPSPWGDGRPGWHIECSAMALRYLGETVDIHCGGVDLVFPHHENEIAQSEAATGKPLAKYWMHNGFINVDNVKMAKSLGNFFTLREAAAAYSYAAVRMFALSAHYRTPLNYSTVSLEQSQSAFNRLKIAVHNLRFFAQKAPSRAAAQDEPAFLDRLLSCAARFNAALDDDLNTADALGALFEAVREINLGVGVDSPRELVEKSLHTILEMTEVLGLREFLADAESLPPEVKSLADRRAAARAVKNWTESDRLRDELRALGYGAEDTQQGQRISRI